MNVRTRKALLFTGVFFAFGALPANSAKPDISTSAEAASGTDAEAVVSAGFFADCAAVWQHTVKKARNFLLQNYAHARECVTRFEYDFLVSFANRVAAPVREAQTINEELPPEADASALLSATDDTPPVVSLIGETSSELGLFSEESLADKRTEAEELPHGKADFADAAFGHEAELRAGADSLDTSPSGVYFDVDKRLRRYAAADELMVILQTEPRLNLITGDANTIIRVNYDEHGRLLTRTVWEVSFEPTANMLELTEKSATNMLQTSAEKAELIADDSESPARKAEIAVDSSELTETAEPSVERTKSAAKTIDLSESAEAGTPDDTPAEGMACKSLTEYRYDRDSPLAVSKTHRIPAEQRLEETRYNLSGNTESVTVYREFDEQQKVSSREDFTYDAENRLVEKTAKTFGEQGKTVTERVQYRYTGKAAEPDCERYHDGKLKFKQIHESKTAYAEIRYMAYGLSVQTYYRDSRKTLELYLQDGKEVRRQQF